jgi:AcrR family transcriptional regulator
MLADMGNREALLEGAKRCLLEKGYARTTARDIADAAGVSLAAIGYHFGSKETLLEQAFMAAMEDWFDDEAADDRHAGMELGSLERLRTFFEEIEASFPQQRPLLRLNIEMGLEGMNNPRLGAFMAGAVHYGRMEMARELYGLEQEKDGEIARQVGSFVSLLMTGLVCQYLMDRERFPSATDLAEGLRYIAERLRPA